MQSLHPRQSLFPHLLSSLFLSSSSYQSYQILGVTLVLNLLAPADYFPKFSSSSKPSSSSAASSDARLLLLPLCKSLICSTLSRFRTRSPAHNRKEQEKFCNDTLLLTSSVHRSLTCCEAIDELYAATQLSAPRLILLLEDLADVLVVRSSYKSETDLLVVHLREVGQDQESERGKRGLRKVEKEKKSEVG
jgi:hypothetical protein